MKAVYNCVADNPDELTFTEGEVIVVDGEEDQEWWVSMFMGLLCVRLKKGSFVSRKDGRGHDSERGERERRR